VTFIVAPIHVTHLIVLALRGYKHEITVYIQPLMSLFPLHRSLPLSDKTVVSTVALGECRFWTRGVADETWVLVERTRDSGLGILRVFRIWYNNNLVASFFFFLLLQVQRHCHSSRSLLQRPSQNAAVVGLCCCCGVVLLVILKASRLAVAAAGNGESAAARVVSVRRPDS
jgi:hypothetical protein